MIERVSATLKGDENKTMSSIGCRVRDACREEEKERERKRERGREKTKRDREETSTFTKIGIKFSLYQRVKISLSPTKRNREIPLYIGERERELRFFFDE